MGSLSVSIDGCQAGEIVDGSDGRLLLIYNDDWRTHPSATPISLSIPLDQDRHPDSVIRPLLRGMLPDNAEVLTRWFRSYQVSPRRLLSLLAAVGKDCAGSIQFDQRELTDVSPCSHDGVVWLGQDEIAERLRLLRRDPCAWHIPNAICRFTLSGAQAKIALTHDPDLGCWHDPRGWAPTTHILKPAISGFDDHDLNEHLCLQAAGLIGISSASSWVDAFEGERVIVVARYDRVRGPDGQIMRIHQEDMCQALGLPPTSKYQSDGGPTPEDIIGLMRRAIRPAIVAEEDIARFVDALAFNWIIAGTDAHAKNYSLALSGSQVRLAPLYDVASALPYEDMYLPRLRMAMRIGGEYRLEAISGRHWRRFAEENSLDFDKVITRIDQLTTQAPEAFEKAAGAASVSEPGSELPGRLASLVAARAGQCRDALAR